MIPDSLEKDTIDRNCQFLQIIQKQRTSIPRNEIHKIVDLYPTPGFTNKALSRLLWLGYLVETNNNIEITRRGIEILKNSQNERYKKMRQDWKVFLKTKRCDVCGCSGKKNLVVFRGQFLCNKCLNPELEKPDYSFVRQYSVFDTISIY